MLSSLGAAVAAESETFTETRGMTVPLACALTRRTPTMQQFVLFPYFRGTTLTCEKESTTCQGSMISNLPPAVTRINQTDFLCGST